LSVAAAVQREHAREPGSVAGGWLRWAESVLPARIDWRRVLAAEVRSAIAAVAGKVDYSYARPSRRAHLSPAVILPTLRRPVPDVAVVCDTSGSMHERLLARALAEIEAVLTRAGLRQAQIRVLAVDTDVHAIRRVSRAAQVQLAGGGGTDMGSGIERAAALRPRPSVVIVLTDGYTPWPDQPPPGIRVIVGLLTEGVRAPGWTPPGWARTVVIEDHD
jgi:predicted metal-dependent peptidase